MSNSGADAFFIAAYGEHFVNIARRMSELGINKPLYGIHSVEDPDIAKEVGHLVDGIIYPYPADPEYLFQNEEMRTEYKDMFGIDIEICILH